MAAQRLDILCWFDEGVRKGATHMIVVCDTWDYEDYAVYVMPGEDTRKKVSEFSGPNMQRVMEVYDLSMDKTQQLDQRRVFNY
jgi:hypothetical protein